jgi:acyl-CoA thioester hydrolase
MKPSPERASVELEIPFHDVDSMQIVWHGHYYKYLEQARTALLRSLGFEGFARAELPYSWVVIESQCRHIHPLRFGDRIRVDAWLVDVIYRVHIAYEIESLTAGKRAARAHTMLATLDANGALLLNTPQPLLALLTKQ